MIAVIGMTATTDAIIATAHHRNGHAIVHHHRTVMLSGCLAIGSAIAALTNGCLAAGNTGSVTIRTILVIATVRFDKPLRS